MSWTMKKTELSLRACKECGYPEPALYVRGYTAPEGTAHHYRVTCMCGITTGRQHTERGAINYWNGIQLGLIDPISPLDRAMNIPNYDVVCYKCGRKNVQTMYWVDSNNKRVIEMIGAYKDEESHYCLDCKEHVRLIYETSYRKEP